MHALCRFAAEAEVKTLKAIESSGPDPTPLEPALTVAEVAELLQCSHKIIYNAIRTRQLPSIRLNGKVLRIPRAGLRRFMNPDAAAVEQPPPAAAPPPRQRRPRGAIE